MDPRKGPLNILQEYAKDQTVGTQGTTIVLGHETSLHERKLTLTIQGTIEFLGGAATELRLKSRSLYWTPGMDH